MALDADVRAKAPPAPVEVWLPKPQISFMRWCAKVALPALVLSALAGLMGALSMIFWALVASEISAFRRVLRGLIDIILFGLSD